MNNLECCRCNLKLSSPMAAWYKLVPVSIVNGEFLGAMGEFPTF